jgi:hypothetical protein
MVYVDVEKVVVMFKVVCVAAESVGRVVPKSEFVEEGTSFDREGVVTENIGMEGSAGVFCRACKSDVTVKILRVVNVKYFRII